MSRHSGAPPCPFLNHPAPPGAKGPVPHVYLCAPNPDRGGRARVRDVRAQRPDAHFSARHPNRGIYAGNPRDSGNAWAHVPPLGDALGVFCRFEGVSPSSCGRGRRSGCRCRPPDAGRPARRSGTSPPSSRGTTESPARNRWRRANTRRSRGRAGRDRTGCIAAAPPDSPSGGRCQVRASGGRQFTAQRPTSTSRHARHPRRALRTLNIRTIRHAEKRPAVTAAG